MHPPTSSTPLRRATLRPVRRWRSGQELPPLDSPCIDFERILREHVRSGSVAEASERRPSFEGP